MATEPTCVCGHPQSSHEADDKYCYDCDCESFAPAPEPSLGDMLRRAEALGRRPLVRLMRDSGEWLAQCWAEPQSESLGYHDFPGETPEAAMAGLLALIEGDGDDH